MDLIAELDDLAHKAVINDDEPAEGKVSQWMKLFAYARDEAINNIQQRNADLGRLVITNDYWSSIKDLQEAAGYDKDAYEHFLESRAAQGQTHQVATAAVPAAGNQKKTTYLMQLSGELSTPQRVQALLGLSESPEVETDDNDPNIRFCRLSAGQRAVIVSKVTPKPLFIALTLLSNKDVDPNSRHLASTARFPSTVSTLQTKSILCKTSIQSGTSSTATSLSQRFLGRGLG